MKFNGKKPNQGKIVHCVIPRENGESMLFIAKGIFDYTPFTTQFPEPKPAVKVEKGIQSLDYNHPTYKKRITEWISYKTHWIVLKSLEDSPELEWETVNMDDPKTWGNYDIELREVLLPNEVAEISNAVMDACALTNQKVEEATQAFLLGAGPELLNLSSPTTELETTQSSEPAKDSISTPSTDGNPST